MEQFSQVDFSNLPQDMPQKRIQQDYATNPCIGNSFVPMLPNPTSSQPIPQLYQPVQTQYVPFYYPTPLPYQPISQYAYPVPPHPQPMPFYSTPSHHIPVYFNPIPSSHIPTHITLSNPIPAHYTSESMSNQDTQTYLKTKKKEKNSRKRRRKAINRKRILEADQDLPCKSAKQSVVPKLTWKTAGINLEQGYAICQSNICVRLDWSKNSEFLTILKKDTYVWILETKENRANIYFGEENGWCTIFLEKEQRFLLIQPENQIKAKESYNAQFIDKVDIYEKEYQANNMNNLSNTFDVAQSKTKTEKKGLNFCKQEVKSKHKSKMDNSTLMRKSEKEHIEVTKWKNFIDHISEFDNIERKYNDKKRSCDDQLGFDDIDQSYFDMLKMHFCHMDHKFHTSSSDNFLYDNENDSNTSIDNFFINACSTGDLEYIQSCFGLNGAYDIEKLKKVLLNENQMKNGFHYACKNGHLKIAKLLLKFRLLFKYHFQKLNLNDFGNPFESFEKKSILNLKKNILNGFLYACKNGHAEIVELLMDYNFHTHVNFCEKEDEYFDNQMLGFSEACVHHHTKILKLFLVKTKYSGKILLKWFSMVCTFGDVESLRLMLENYVYSKDFELGFSIFSLSFKNSKNYFYQLCKNDKIEMLKLSIEYGLDLSQQDEDLLNEGFLYACEQGHFEFIKFLLENYSSNTNLEYRYKCNNLTGFLHHIISNIASYRTINYKLLNYLIEKGVNLHATDNRGNNALFIALANENIPLIKFLISKGIDWNAKNRLGKTPFIQCCISKSSNDVLDLLLEYGVDLTERVNIKAFHNLMESQIKVDHEKTRSYPGADYIPIYPEELVISGMVHGIYSQDKFWDKIMQIWTYQYSHKRGHNGYDPKFLTYLLSKIRAINLEFNKKKNIVTNCWTYDIYILETIFDFLDRKKFFDEVLQKCPPLLFYR